MTRTRALVFVIVLQFACLGWLGYRIVNAVDQIQAQRIDATLANCQAQNSRHHHTVLALDEVLARAAHGKSAVQRAQIEASRGPTILLINALAPYQKCAAVVRKATTGH